MLAVDDPRLEQRNQAQLHRRRIATRVADDARALDLVAMELGQAIHRFLEEIWARVRENFSDEQRARMNRDFLAAKKRVKVS